MRQANPYHFAFVFVLFIAVLGFLPHALFSLEVGGWHYMSTAWDEDSYTRYALENNDVVFRIASAALVRFLVATFGLDVGLIVLDTVIPALAALVIAGIVWHIGFRSWRALLLSACLLAFALELMALCNTAMIGGDPGKVLPFSSFIYPHWLRQFMPNLIERFFSLYKSPEPQVSLLMQFLCMFLLLRHAQTQRFVHLAFLLLLSTGFVYFYVSTGIGLLVLIAFYAAFGVMLTRKRDYIVLLFGTLLSGALYAYLFTHTGVKTETDIAMQAASRMTYASHLPIFSASMLWAGFALFVWYKQKGQALIASHQWRSITAIDMLVLALCAEPFITLNQQIITGQMVQSRTWDYYTNVPFAALAVLLLWPQVTSLLGSRLPRRLKTGARYVLPVLLLLIVLAQHKTYRSYRPSNLDNLAVAQWLRKDKVKHPALLLEAIGDDSQISLRMGPPYPKIISSYQETIRHPIALLEKGDEVHEASIVPLKDQAFTYFDRKCTPAEKLKLSMERAAEATDGSESLMFFFAPLDAWGPLSDFRSSNAKGILEHVPEVAKDYEAFLADPKRRYQFGELLYITRTKRETCEQATWKETIAGETAAGKKHPVTVYIYRQTPP